MNLSKISKSGCDLLARLKPLLVSVSNLRSCTFHAIKLTSLNRLLLLLNGYDTHKEVEVDFSWKIITKGSKTWWSWIFPKMRIILIFSYSPNSSSISFLRYKKNCTFKYTNRKLYSTFYISFRVQLSKDFEKDDVTFRSEPYVGVPT